jgi:hypothetical protein
VRGAIDAAARLGYRTRFVTDSTLQTNEADPPPLEAGPVLVAGRQHSGNTMLTVLLGRMPGWYAQSDESTLLEMHGLFDSMSDIEARSKALVKAIGLEDPEQAG